MRLFSRWRIRLPYRVYSKTELDFEFGRLGASDLVLRNKNTGAFEVYDIAGNTLVGAASLGAVGLDWQLGGFAIDPPSNESSAGQLVQAMAGFGGDTADDSDSVFLGADTSLQPLLTTPHA